MIQDLILSGLVDGLARYYDVVCFDRPGFGYRQRPRTQSALPLRWPASSPASAARLRREGAVEASNRRIMGKAQQRPASRPRGP
jgi:pimeloyl-ACP methyl ester carboxylesterase